MGLISNGTTIFDNGAMASGFGGSMVFISSATASASASIEFTSGIDSTYKEYVFYFVNIHPSASNSYFQFNMSTDGGSNYNVTKTSTWFQSYHAENDSFAGLGYNTSRDLAQSTNYQDIGTTMTTFNDLSLSGTLQIFNPSSTTYVKHFIAMTNQMADFVGSNESFCAGYGNTTSAVNAISFRMDTGNIDDGKILMFGIN